jgi:uncharacterized protein YaiI (UPF0178 family)
MKLYIDGDAFPTQLKAIIFRAIERHALKTFVVANKRVNIGNSEHINYIVVGREPDEADNRIVEMLEEGDLVLTADIPLADRALSKKAHALNFRGQFYDSFNIKNSLAMRNLMQELRESGTVSGGQQPFNQKNAHEFANQLNKFLTKYKLS